MKNLLKILSFGAILIVLIGILSVVFNGGDLAARGSVIYYDRKKYGPKGKKHKHKKGVSNAIQER